MQRVEKGWKPVPPPPPPPTEPMNESSNTRKTPPHHIRGYVPQSFLAVMWLLLNSQLNKFKHTVWSGEEKEKVNSLTTPPNDAIMWTTKWDEHLSMIPLVILRPWLVVLLGFKPTTCYSVVSHPTCTNWSNHVVVCKMLRLLTKSSCKNQNRVERVGMRAWLPLPWQLFWPTLSKIQQL